MRLLLIAGLIVSLLGGLAPMAHAQDGKNEEVAKHVKQLQDKDAAVRLKAIESLSKLGVAAKEAIPSLIDLLEDSDKGVREAAQKALVEIKRAKPTTNLKTDNPTEPAGKLADLIKQIKSPRVETSVAASEELAKMGTDARDAIPAIVEVMLTRDIKLKDSRLAAAEALEKIYPDLHKPVMRVLVDNNLSAAAQIGELGPEAKGAMPLLMALYKTTQSANKQYSTFIIAMHKVAPEDKAVTDIIVKTAKSSTSLRYDRRAALQMLSEREVAVQECSSIFLGALSAKENDIRNLALDELMKMAKEEKIKPESMVTPLRTLLKDTYMQYKAIECLGDLGPAAKAAIPDLRQLKTAMSETTRTAAGKAIAKIQGE